MTRKNISPIDNLKRLWHHPRFRDAVARIGYNPIVERIVTGLQVDRLIHRALFPMSTEIQVLGEPVDWTLPTIYSYLNLDYSSDSDTWLEGELSKRLADEVEPGDVVFDLGARWGYQTLIAAFASDETGTVVSFEPFTPHRKTLQRTIGENDIPAEVRTEMFALGDEIKTVEFDLSRNEHSPRLNPDNETSREVPMTTLDAFVTENESPDFLDVDIEGAELMFLRGGQKTLTDHQPTIFLEIHDREMVLGSWEEIYSLLLEGEYELELVEGEESRFVESPPEYDHAHDLIARPRDQ